MRTRSKYYQQLSPLLSRPSFTVKDAASIGVPREALARLTNRGLLERLGPGIYRSTSYESDYDIRFDELTLTARSIPNGVICLISALKYYDLTEEIPREYWIAIPNSQKAPVRPYTRIIRMRDTQLGRTTVLYQGRKFAIFDRERCVVDAFRYLSVEVAIKALRAYLSDKSHRPDLNKLSSYAKTLRVNIRPYIMSLTT